MPAVNDIIKGLGSLPNEELQTLRAAVTALLSMRGAGGAAPAADVAPENYGQDVAGLLNEVLSERGMQMLPLEQIAKVVKDYRGVSARLWAFARRAITDGKRVEHLAIIRLGLRMLVDNIESQGIPITHAVVMRQLDRLPAVVDWGFPGYTKNGFLGLLVRSGLHGGS